MRLLVITDIARATEDEHVEAYARLKTRVPNGALWIQLRDARRTAREQLAFGRKLMEIGAPVVVNDRLDVAKALGARGVHLGRASVSVAEARAFLGAAAWISRALHAEEIATFAPGPLDAVVLSPIFESPGKAAALGTAALRRFRELHSRVAVIALGGVDGDNAASCFDSGASAVAVIRAALDPVASERLSRALSR